MNDKQSQKEIHENKDFEEEPEDSRLVKILKRTFIIFISIILLLFILTYLLPSYSFLNIIAGQFSSYEIKDDHIFLRNGEKIVFEDNSYENLLETYYDNQQHEFKACLLGEKDGDTYRVNEIKIPKIFSQDFSSVTAELCNKDAIISLHSHPFKSCFLSVHDVRGFRTVRNINGDAIIGIMCEAERFNFYGFE